jgi:hypothetical protein
MAMRVPWLSSPLVSITAIEKPAAREPLERRAQLADLFVIEHRRRLGGAGAVPVCDRALGVEIEHADLLARLLGGNGQIEREDGFARPALLIDEASRRAAPAGAFISVGCHL